MDTAQDDWWNEVRDPVEDALSDCRAGHYGAGGRVLAAEIERLRTANKDLREIGHAARTYSESTRDRAFGDPNRTWRELNDVLAYRGAVLDDETSEEA